VSDERTTELIASARGQAERFKRERDIERAVGERERIEAAYGRALLRFTEQLRRLRRNAAAGSVPFDMGRDEQAEAIRGELAEALAEPHGSETEAREIMDVLASVLQFHIGTGAQDAELLRDIDEAADRLAGRLDLVDAGLDWRTAKAAKSDPRPEMIAAVVALRGAVSPGQQQEAVDRIVLLLDAEPIDADALPASKPLVFAIRPEFVDAFASGAKLFEFRTRRPSVDMGDTVLIYETAPMSKIVATATVRNLFGGTPEQIWMATEGGRGIERDEFNRYFDGRSHAYAIRLDAKFLDVPLALPSCMKPPQSWTRWRGPWPLPKEVLG
jgi:predicted transcriptional regulator